MVQVLILENNGKSSASIYKLLQNEGPQFHCKLVKNREQYLQALLNAEFDVAVASYALPNYDGFKAFREFKAKDHEQPFILCTPPLDKGLEINLVKQGIPDFVTTNNLDLLPAKIKEASNNFQVHVQANSSQYYSKEEKRKDDKLKQKEEDFENLSLIAKYTHNGVIIADKNMQIQWINKAFTHMTGYHLDEILNKRPPDILVGPETDKKMVDDQFEQLETGKVVNFESVNYKKDGMPFWVRIEIIPVYKNETIDKYIFLFTDISSRKQEDLERKRLIQDLQSNNFTLEQYAYITSHNLRAPIAQIIGLTNLLGSNIDDNDFHQYVQYLQESARNLDSIISDLNYLLLVRNDKDLTNEFIYLKTLLNELLEEFHYPLQTEDVYIEWNFTKYALINSNRDYLKNIFHNLLDNSIKFRKKNSPLYIYLTFDENEEDYILSISDNGTGFDANRHKERLFRPYQFFNEDLEGKGLGLSIVKAYVDALGGHIEGDSKEGVGTTFKIIIPKMSNPEF